MADKFWTFIIIMSVYYIHVLINNKLIINDYYFIIFRCIIKIIFSLKRVNYTTHIIIKFVESRTINLDSETNETM